MNKKIRYFFWTAILFLCVELIARMFDFYAKYTYYDDISHLLFGFSLYSALKILRNFNVNIILIIYTFIALFWELLEKIGDKLFEQPTYLLDYFYFDGVFDIIFGYIGIFIAHYIYQRCVK